MQIPSNQLKQNTYLFIEGTSSILHSEDQCLQTHPEIMPIYLGRRATLESLGHRVTTDKYQNNLHPIGVIAKKMYPCYFL